MKIECPSCHMSGNINEMELPPDGRSVHCPRCKKNFHVAKPALVNGLQVTICPGCKYSTFTDETFAVCPKCGLNAGEHKEILRKREERELREKQRTEVPTQSHQNPDLVVPQESVSAKVKVPEPVRNTGLVCIAVGIGLFFYGFMGLTNYYSKDWQLVLADTMLEPLSNSQVFFKMGFLPWVITIFSACFLTVASQFLLLQRWAHKGLTGCAWGGIAVAAIVGVADFIKWISVSSSTPSFSYYVVGIMGSLFMVLLWSVPFCALLWYLRQKSILRIFPEY